MDLLIAYNSAGPWADQELYDEYQASMMVPLPNKLYFTEYRTVSLGKVMHNVVVGVVIVGVVFTVVLSLLLIVY